ncbi:MAG: hypothetical protein SVK54_09035, partial [candidate division WOR-3 bacterium]|nr:hypothetical protein [candidate division WOR-3 bacterium]
MKRFTLFTFIILMILIVSCSSIDRTPISDAEQLFKEGKPVEAFETVEAFHREHPGDAEALYYLGRYLHFIQYDTGKRVFDKAISDSIINYLDKSIAITDTIGNAFYYLGVEYGMQGHYAFFEGESLKAKEAFAMGHKKGGYPLWLLEFARNVFLSCDSNAILFTGGDAEANALWYLQTVEGLRRDVTVMPAGLLSYPPFVKFVKRGIEGFFRPVPITMSDSDIDSFTHRYFDNDSAVIEVSSEMKNKYSLDEGYTMKWALKPDYVFQGKEIITPGTGIIIHMLKNNKWERPAYFTIASIPNMRASLDEYLYLEGLCYRIMPVEAGDETMDVEFTASLLMDISHIRYYP